ncbi:Bax inhibitor-1/YccA family protein [Ruminococcus sp. Marseille-P6503]|uniref:Bax inhibitor-1/YccA family protein n=1 Tax=Ruminococcus sp. Marseille-P6503 TaxID=2364796 RepID=UPI000F53D6C5|nr:Bax inhibitor-1/YccA family protein [Ruminococcus sp. Marseille-P6503]
MAVNSRRKMFTNPAISKIERFDDAFSGAETASYKGILAKTLYFLAVILIGMGAFFYIHNYFGSQGYTGVEVAEGYYVYANESAILFGALIVTLISGLVASFAVGTIPVTGTIYCAGMGYAVTFVSYTYAAAYSGIIVEALLLTVLIIGAMALLYTSGWVKIGNGFRTVVYTCLLVSLIGGIIFSLMLWLAPNSAIVVSILRLQNGPLGIVFAVLGVLLASALLLTDFETIAQTVENGLSKKYEWYCSYGLMVSVIYLYLKILELLARIQNSKK